MGNSRNRQFIRFKLSAVLDNMMKSSLPAPSHLGRESPLCPAYPLFIHSPPISHLVAIWVTRSVMCVRERERAHSHNSYCSILL